MKIYEVSVDLYRKRKNRIDVEEFTVIKETPKTWVATINKNGYEYRFLKDKENRVKKSFSNVNTRFEFFTTDEQKIESLVAETIRHSLVLMKDEISKIEADIASAEETLRGIEGE